MWIEKPYTFDTQIFLRFLNNNSKQVKKAKISVSIKCLKFFEYFRLHFE